MASHLGLELTLVFDAAYQEGPGSISHYDKIGIIFTEESQSADDFLIQQLEHEDNPRNTTLVTSDNRLAWRARSIGAKTLSVEEFLGWLRARIDKSRTPRTQKPSPIDDSWQSPPQPPLKKAANSQQPSVEPIPA